MQWILREIIHIILYGFPLVSLISHLLIKLQNNKNWAKGIDSEATVAIVQKWIFNVIVDSDLLIMVHAIRRSIRPTTQVSNLIVNPIDLARTVENMKFVHRSRSANELIEKIVKKVNFCCL